MHFDNNSQFFKNQQMHCIIKYCLISPTVAEKGVGDITQ